MYTVFHLCPLSFPCSLFTILVSLSIFQGEESVYTCKKEENIDNVFELQRVHVIYYYYGLKLHMKRLAHLW